MIQQPRANAIITNITEESDATGEKRKRKSRAQLSPGRPLSFYEVVELVRTRYLRSRTHPSTSVVWWGKPMSIFYLVSQPFARVMDGAMRGDLREVVYPPGYRCRCNECNVKVVKKPRGPKRQPDGTILYKHFQGYRGALDFEEMRKLLPLVREIFYKEDPRDLLQNR